MTVQKWYQHFIEDVIDAEKVILAIMVVMSGYMVWDTAHFNIESAKVFPRLAGGVVFIGATLLLFRGFFPDRIEQMILNEGAAFEASEEYTEREQSTAEEQTASTAENKDEMSSVGRPIHDSVATALLVVGYAILGYAIGLIWASPLFVIAYARWFRIDWLRTIALAAVGFGIAYSFMVVLNVPMDAGHYVLKEGVLWLQ